LVNYFIFGSRGIFRDPTTSFPQGRLIEESARLGSFGTTRTYPTVLIAVALAIGLYWFMKRSNYGYETSVFADSPNTARYAGMSSTKLTLSVLLFSGALAGLAGSMYVVGPAGKVDPGLLQIGLGYAGIVVAALARYNFVAVILTAILFAGLREGGASLQISSNPVPISIAVVLQGSVLLFALGGEVFRRNRLRIRRVQQVSVAS
jgi:simple sugar transport system permease protein